MEADYSQLEIIGLAFLSQDKLLCQDIKNGIDLHCMSAAGLYGLNYEDVLAGYQAEDPEMTKKRKIAKGFSFQLQYGSGAKAMADQLGLPLKMAQKFIKVYYERYKGVKEYQEYVKEAVMATRAPSALRTVEKVPAGLGQFTSVTGRRYVFQEFDAPAFLVEKGIKTSFSPTQMKNYPVQGFATGDVVPLMMGEVYESLKANPLLRTKALLINTVHDSIMLDVHPDAIDRAALLVKQVLENAPYYIKMTWGLEFDLPLKVDITTGPSWASQTQYEFK
jgi:DNA polymerase I-like protein with 3'-5' exonuclease and polymerase domains